MIYVQLCLWILLTILWYCRMCQSKWREDLQKFTARMDSLRVQAERTRLALKHSSTLDGKAKFDVFMAHQEKILQQLEAR